MTARQPVNGLNGAEGVEVRPLVDSLREVMSRHVGVVRDRNGLHAARSAIQQIAREIAGAPDSGRTLWEARNLALAGMTVVAAALGRQESRGAHFRQDYPATEPALDGRHSLLIDPAAGEWSLGPLADVFSDSARATMGPASRL
jgi:aspartate oxidase